MVRNLTTLGIIEGTDFFPIYTPAVASANRSDRDRNDKKAFFRSGANY
jgi:hypothetical protein